jgi:hypothetical protein
MGSPRACERERGQAGVTGYMALHAGSWGACNNIELYMHEQGIQGLWGQALVQYGDEVSMHYSMGNIESGTSGHASVLTWFSIQGNCCR